jgi:hypothetical protein
MNQAICFEVMALAEMIRSPSFSRFSSSNTMTNLPALMSATVSSMESNVGDDELDDAVVVELEGMILTPKERECLATVLQVLLKEKKRIDAKS